MLLFEKKTSLKKNDGDGVKSLPTNISFHRIWSLTRQVPVFWNRRVHSQKCLVEFIPMLWTSDSNCQCSNMIYCIFFEFTVLLPILSDPTKCYRADVISRDFVLIKETLLHRFPTHYGQRKNYLSRCDNYLGISWQNDLGIAQLQLNVRGCQIYSRCLQLILYTYDVGPGKAREGRLGID
jgi:hypothetical protein